MFAAFGELTPYPNLVDASYHLGSLLNGSFALDFVSSIVNPVLSKWGKLLIPSRSLVFHNGFSC